MRCVYVCMRERRTSIRCVILVFINLSFEPVPSFRQFKLFFFVLQFSSRTRTQAHSINLILIQQLKQFISFAFGLIEMFIPFCFCSNLLLKIVQSVLNTPHCVQREARNVCHSDVFLAVLQGLSVHSRRDTVFIRDNNTNDSFRLEITTTPRCARSFQLRQRTAHIIRFLSLSLSRSLFFIMVCVYVSRVNNAT